jgi:hypothetical protein
MFDPLVLQSKTAYMQAISSLVGVGYSAYAEGEVPLDRCLRMVKKFSDLYFVGVDKDSRYRRKRSGLGNAHMLLWEPFPQAYRLRFVLLISSGGSHPAKEFERLRDATDRKTRMDLRATLDDSTDYELVQHSRPGQLRPSWSWRINSRRFDAYRHALLRAVHQHRIDELAALLVSLSRTPGFALIRRQVFELRSLAKSAWRTSAGSPFPVPTIRISYVSRVAHKGTRLSTIVRCAERSVLTLAE